MKRFTLLILSCFLFVACTPSPEPVAVVTVGVTRPVLTPTSIPTSTAPPTTPAPTNTLAPELTKTITPRPTATITPTPEPTRDPFLMYDFDPQRETMDGFQFELNTNEALNDLILHITGPNGFMQELSAHTTIIHNDPYGFTAIGGGSILLWDYEKDHRPEVIFDITIANCCTTMFVAYYDSDLQQYATTNLLVRSLSPQIVDIDQGGQLEFVTRNELFNFFAGGLGSNESLSPIQIYRYQNKSIEDVSHEYPHLVEQDALFWLAIAQNQDVQVSGDYLALMGDNEELWRGWQGERLIFATYLADMVVLGRGAEGCATVNHYDQDESCPAFLEQVIRALEMAKRGIEVPQP